MQARISLPYRSSHRLLIAQSMVGVFLFWVALYLFVPTLPLYAHSKTSDLTLVGLALSQYGLWQALLRFPLGLTADWLGRRKPFILIGFATIYSFTPILARQFSANNVAIGLLTTTNLAATLVGNLFATALIMSVSECRLVYASLGLIAVGLGMSAAAPTLPWLFVSQLLVGVAGGLGFPTLMGMSIANVNDSQRSTAMGLHQAVYGIGMFAGPWLGGLLASALGIQPMFAVIAMVVFGLGIGGNYVINSKREFSFQEAKIEKGE